MAVSQETDFWAKILLFGEASIPNAPSGAPFFSHWKTHSWLTSFGSLFKAVFCCISQLPLGILIIHFSWLCILFQFIQFMGSSFQMNLPKTLISSKCHFPAFKNLQCFQNKISASQHGIQGLPTAEKCVLVSFISKASKQANKNPTTSLVVKHILYCCFIFFFSSSKTAWDNCLYSAPISYLLVIL